MFKIKTIFEEEYLTIELETDNSIYFLDTKISFNEWTVWYKPYPLGNNVMNISVLPIIKEITFYFPFTPKTTYKLYKNSFLIPAHFNFMAPNIIYGLLLTTEYDTV